MSYPGPESEILHERYARALFAVAEESHKIDAVSADLDFMKTLVREDKTFSKILKNPEIEIKEKLAVLERISKKRRFTNEFFSFLKLLLKKDRFGLIHGTFLRYRDICDRKKGRIPVFVRTAFSLKKTEIERLKKILEQKLKTGVMIREIIDKSCLGGIDIKIKDLIYGASLEGRLKIMEEMLKIS